MFFHKVTSRIEKCIFQVLFPKGKKAGRSVSSIRILVAMSILKEGFGSSDEELFEKCEFDILTRRALGLVLLDDVLPSLDTYYLLRRRICDYYVATGTDLLQLCFEQVTGAQVKELKISGKCVQMDSKLIGSNIASCSRHELIHKTLKLYLNSVGIDSLPEDIQVIAESWFSEDSSKTIYRSDHDTLHNRLQAIGEYIYAILTSVVPSHGRYDLLERLFNEQYSVTEDRVQLRDKNGHKTQGYVTNITETVEDGKPSIITSVQVETATHGDCTFLPDAVSNSECVTQESVTEVFIDGTYQSPDNRDLAFEKGFWLKTGKMQGGCRFVLKLMEETNELMVTDTITGEVVQAVYVGKTEKHGRRWWIRVVDATPRYPWQYFTEKKIANSALRQQIQSQDPKELAKRNNVEAAMFQYSFHTRNGKTRYREMLKHRMQAIHRCIWMNFRRMVIFLYCAIFSILRTLLRGVRSSMWKIILFLEQVVERDYVITLLGFREPRGDFGIRELTF